MSTQKKRESLTRTNRWLRAAPVLLVPFLFVGGGPETEPVAADVPEVTIEALGARLPLHVNARVERWMRRFQTTPRASFETLLQRPSLNPDALRRRFG